MSNKLILISKNNKLQENGENLATEKYVLDHHYILKVDIENIDNKIDIIDTSIIPKITNNENKWTKKNTFEDYVDFYDTIKTKNLEVNNNANINILNINNSLVFKNNPKEGLLHSDSNGYTYLDKVINSDILDKTIKSEKLEDNIILTGTPTMNNTPLITDKSNKIVNSQYVNDILLKSINELKANVVTSLNTLEKIGYAIENDPVFYTKLAKLAGASFSGNVYLKKYSFESQIIYFKEINEINYIIEDDNIYNYRALDNVNRITLPILYQDGQTIYIQNSSNNTIIISSNKLMYHSILTPSQGCSELIINPNITLCFVFNSRTNPFWSIIA
jgi:hypothetical protein